MVLLLFLQRRRFSGLRAGAAGAALCYIIYVLWTPQAHQGLREATHEDSP